MLLLGHLAKIQGLKGEFLLHATTDDPGRMTGLTGLVLAPPNSDLSRDGTLPAGTRPVAVRSFRWHQDRPCVAFEGVSDRTAAEALKGWSLWMPEVHAHLAEGESYRHEWIGCDVLVAGTKVGEVLRLDPTPGGYDMVLIRDTRPGRRGQRQIPYVKAWFQLDLPHCRIHVDPPEGLLDLDQIGE